MATAFLICIVIPRLCWRKMKALLSFVLSVAFAPISRRKFIEFGSKAPNVSKEKGRKTRLFSWGKVLYFWACSSSRCAGIDAAGTLARCRREEASLCAHVKSHTTDLPWDQRIRLTPSGSFPSVRESPGAQVGKGSQRTWVHVGWRHCTGCDAQG